MTKLPDRAVEAACTLSPVLQDEIAGVMLRSAGGDGDIAPVNSFAG